MEKNVFTPLPIWLRLMKNMGPSPNPNQIAWIWDFCRFRSNCCTHFGKKVFYEFDFDHSDLAFHHTFCRWFIISQILFYRVVLRFWTFVSCDFSDLWSRCPSCNCILLSSSSRKCPTISKNSWGKFRRKWSCCLLRVEVMRQNEL